MLNNGFNIKKVYFEKCYFCREILCYIAVICCSAALSCLYIDYLLPHMQHSLFSFVLVFFFFLVIIYYLVRPNKKIVMLPSPDQNLKIGSVGRFFFFFFFFLRTMRELSFPNIFFLVSKWGKLGRNAVKTHIYKCFFKPLNTNFSKFFAQILTF